MFTMFFSPSVGKQFEDANCQRNRNGM